MRNTEHDMEKRNSLTLTLDQPFVAGTDDFYPFYHRLHKLNCAIILYCRSGRATIAIDLKRYEITENTQVVLLPGTVISLEERSDDLQISFFASHVEIFREACIRFEPSFFHFLKEKPCYTLPPEFTGAINGLLHATSAIYADTDNCFRNQIARNHLQSFLLDVYDKVHRLFTHKEIEGGNRPNELFHKFVALVHENCCSQRDVVFYADKLCISTKYLTSICRMLMGGSAKKVIDDFTVLEIKVLLQSTDLSIQAIADQLNFPDQSYLGRYFKRHEGVSPMEYRANVVV